MTEREGFEASNARALNGFLVLVIAVRSTGVSLATKYPDGAGYLLGAIQLGCTRLCRLAGQNRTASWLKADKSTHGRQVR
jgi:hypothetical protein